MPETRAQADSAIAAYAKTVVDQAPPLSREQIDRIAVLLRRGAAG
jgi:hypothetical protein